MTSVPLPLEVLETILKYLGWQQIIQCREVPGYYNYGTYVLAYTGSFLGVSSVARLDITFIFPPMPDRDRRW